MKKLTTKEFILRAKKTHGEKYDYSKSEYKTAHDNICIICPIHGEFWQIADTHVRGHGCPLCRNNESKKDVFGVGVNDLNYSSKEHAYKCWHSMLKRCYYPRTFTTHPLYKDCFVCDDWLVFSKFKEWFDKHYVEGWCIDKDIIVKGNKEYAPEKCCFVPVEINNMFKNGHNQETIRCVRMERGKYSFRCPTQNGRTTKRGFSTAQEAFESYLCARREYIIYLANKHKGKLNKVVYNILTTKT